jgi:hypothetical protein
MSLFNFFQSYIEENPDLLKINNFTNPIYYDQLYDYNRANVYSKYVLIFSKEDLKLKHS